MQCKATTKGRERCDNDAEAGWSFCEEHKNRPKARAEREDRVIGDVVENVSTVSDALSEPEPPQGGQTVQIRPEPTQVIQQQSSASSNIFDRVLLTLQQVTEFEEDARLEYQKRLELAKAGDPEALRYTDKAGAEQTRAEISTYERAMDRTIRIVTAAAKLNIDNQAVNVNNMLKDVVKSVVTRVFQRMELDPDQIAMARQYLNEEFAKQSKKRD